MKLPFRKNVPEPEILTSVAKRIRRRKIKEVNKPWGKAERAVVLLFLSTTTAASAFLAIRSRNNNFFPKLSINIPHMEVKGESTIVIENKLSQKKVDETKTQILNTINNLNGTYGVLSEDLNGSYSLGISENQQFEGASFFKLPLAIAVYEKSEKANFNLDDTYVLNDADKMLGAGILVGIPSGTSISYRDILKALLNNSDNTAFNILYNQVGGNAVQEVIDQIGMTNTSYADSLTTPADIALLFKKLMNGKLINDTSKQEMLGFLTKTDYESFLPAAFPELRVAHKYGEEIGTINDGGIVFAPKPFIFIVMSKDIDQDEAMGAIPKIAQIVYKNLQ